MTDSPFSLLIPAVFAGLLVTAAISDLRHYVIPNWISAALVLLFVVSVAVTPGPVTIVPRMMTAVAILAFGLVLFMRGWIGGGDVKLWAVLGLWLGPAFVLPHLILVCLFGGLLGVGLLCARLVRVARRTSGEQLPILKSAVPYGVPICAAAVWLMPKLTLLGF